LPKAVIALSKICMETIMDSRAAEALAERYGMVAAGVMLSIESK